MDKLVALYVAVTLPALFLALFVVTGMGGGSVEFSGGAFAQPYSGGNSAVSIALAALALGHLVVYHLYLLPEFAKAQETRLVAFASAEMTAILGFIIAFMNLNPWAALPYFAVSLGNMCYAWMRFSQQ